MARRQNSRGGHIPPRVIAASRQLPLPLQMEEVHGGMRQLHGPEIGIGIAEADIDRDSVASQTARTLSSCARDHALRELPMAAPWAAA